MLAVFYGAIKGEHAGKYDEPAAAQRSSGDG